jgi:hypothetical protein
MTYIKSNHPKYRKHNYWNKESMWVKVDGYDEGSETYYDQVDNIPVS